MRVLLVVMDGLGDRPVKRGKTPLQLAKHPVMDSIAKGGISGISDPICPGTVPGSDTSHLAILGYNPFTFYAGRGILEALGSGVKVYEGDVALRCNFATVDSRMNVIDRRAGRIDGKDAVALAEAIGRIKIKDTEFIFSRTKGHRGVLIIRNNSSPMITDIDSHGLGSVMWAKPLDATDPARRTAEALNEWTKRVNQILKAHPVNKAREKAKLPPANIIISRGASALAEGLPYKGATYWGPHAPTPVKVQRFQDKFGMSAACIAGGALYKGVARYLGMDVLDVKSATANLDTDVVAKVEATVSALKRNDFVFLHLKGCDVAGHDGNWQAKVKFIEKADKALKPLLSLKDTLIIITGAHSTACSLKAHSANPVPIAICAPDGVVRVDDVKKFDELSAVSGGLGKMTHSNIMPIVLGLIGKAPMYGT